METEAAEIQSIMEFNNKPAGLCRCHNASIKKTGSTTTVEPAKKERRDEEYSIISRYHANLKK